VLRATQERERAELSHFNDRVCRTDGCVSGRRTVSIMMSLAQSYGARGACPIDFLFGKRAWASGIGIPCADIDPAACGRASRHVKTAFNCSDVLRCSQRPQCWNPDRCVTAPEPHQICIVQPQSITAELLERWMLSTVNLSYRTLRTLIGRFALGSVCSVSQGRKRGAYAPGVIVSASERNEPSHFPWIQTPTAGVSH
jgi:hypothetical protein